MATNDKWKRWKSYQETGKWPETEKQQKAREAKEKEAAEPTPEVEEAHPAASQQLAEAPKIETHEEKVARLWWAANPDVPRPGSSE